MTESKLNRLTGTTFNNDCESGSVDRTPHGVVGLPSGFTCLAQYAYFLVKISFVVFVIF
jgi:hypothetical protein